MVSILIPVVPYRSNNKKTGISMPSPDDVFIFHCQQNRLRIV